MPELVQVTENQKFIMAGAAKVVRECLDVVEVFALEDSRREKLKQIIENSVYKYRDDLLKKLTLPPKAAEIYKMSQDKNYVATKAIGKESV